MNMLPNVPVLSCGAKRLQLQCLVGCAIQCHLSVSGLYVEALAIDTSQPSYSRQCVTPLVR
jgi:hypothetical protein